MNDMDIQSTSGLAPDADLIPVDIDGDGSTDWYQDAEDPGTEIYDLGAGATALGRDVDGDGDWESLATDQDGDGRADVTLVDQDGDGSLETVDVDLPGSVSFGPGTSTF